MASNGSTIVDEDGDAEDWVEIYYSGEDPLHLLGYGLSDDYERPFRWTFPDITIQSGEFLLIWASGKNRQDPFSELHTNYSISGAGEAIILTAPVNERIDELKPVEIPTDISLGRYPDGIGDWFFYSTPTPGEPNGSNGYQDILEPVAFSHTPGFYSRPFELTLTHPDPDATILYTLDGSEPDPDNIGGQTYSYMDRYRPSGDIQNRSYKTQEYEPGQSIEITERTDAPNYLSHMQSAVEQSETPYYFPDHNIFKGNVLRVKAVKEGMTSADTETNTYFVTGEGANRYSLPVISLSTQEDNLFDYESGIYVPGKIYNETNPWQVNGDAQANYTQRGLEWERPASMELFDNMTGNLLHKQDIGVRIHGGWSRFHPIKSLRLYARNQYGDNRFYHRMFPAQPYSEYNRLILRNGGNDWDNMIYREAMMQEIVKHMRFDTQAYRPIVMFINGEYWGIHNLRERFDKHYLARVHGIDPENIDLLEANGNVKEGDNFHYNQTVSYLQNNDMTDPNHYEYIQTRIDTENFIDYQIAQIFLGNTDWPGNNIDFWRLRTGHYSPDASPQHDGRWRWLLYDTDFGFGLYDEGADHNTLEFATAADGPDWPNPRWSTFLLRTLLENNTFRQDFITRYLDQLNSAFLSERMIEIIQKMGNDIQPEIAEHHDRWNRPWGGLKNWKDRIEQRLVPFAEERPDYARQHIREYFDIVSEYELTVDVSDPAGGRVDVNTIEITPETPGINSDPWPWSGTYFGEFPVTLRAVPYPGYQFSHWEGLHTDYYLPEISLELNSPLSITAIFEEDSDADLFPKAFSLKDDDYYFDEWSATAPFGSYPENMAFVYMDEQDPGLTASVAGFTDGVFDLDSKTRMNGLGEEGFAFINTGNSDGNPGYPGTRLGGAILALDTRDMKKVQVQWEGSTILPNSRAYNLRLQYRIGNEGNFVDVTDERGNYSEYKRNDIEGHSELVGPVILPQTTENKAYVQLLWRYYYSGERLDEESGQRSKMAVTSIQVEGQLATSTEDRPELPEEIKLSQNYPNPFNPVTVIGYQLPKTSNVTLEVFDMLGRRVALLAEGNHTAGTYQAEFDASNLASGMYLYRLQTDDIVQIKKMTLIK